MSSRITTSVLAVLFSAPVVGLIGLAVVPHAAPLPRPVSTATTVTPTSPLVARPSVGVWRVVCPPNRDGWQGPYGNPDDCRRALTAMQAVCRRPLLAPNVPDPAFVRYAETCRDAFDATACHCDFLVVTARYPTPTEVLFPTTAQ